MLYGHVFRNAMMISIAGFPASFIGVLFAGSLLIEVIFSLDGLGLLGFEAALNRDYPVMFGTLYFFGAGRPDHGHRRRPDVHRRRSADRLRGAPRMTPINRRRSPQFRASKRGMISLVVFGAMFFISLFAELLANDRPLLIRYDGAFYMPVFRDYPETTFGGDLPTNAVYTDSEVVQLIGPRAGCCGR